MVVDPGGLPISVPLKSIRRLQFISLSPLNAQPPRTSFSLLLISKFRPCLRLVRLLCKREEQASPAERSAGEWVIATYRRYRPPSLAPP